MVVKNMEASLRCPPRPPEPGLVHPHHPLRLRLRIGQLDRPRATTARCTVGHDTPCDAAASD
jgi:hypothetical protein